MNPVLILIVILVLFGSGKQNGRNAHASHVIGKAANLKVPPAPTYFDTFKMDLLLDRLHTMTNALEKVNRLSQMRSTPMTKMNSMERIQDSLDAIRGFLSDGKASRQIDTLTGTLSSVKKFGDLENMMSAMGPILSMLSGNDDK